MNVMKVATRDLVLSAARDVFAGKGYHRVSGAGRAASGGDRAVRGARTHEPDGLAKLRRANGITHERNARSLREVLRARTRRGADERARFKPCLSKRAKHPGHLHE